MRKTIQKIAGLIALSVSLLNHTPAFAAVSHLTEQHFNIHAPWSLGVKFWWKVPIKTIAERLSFGSELVVGPFVEWKPFNGRMGLQTGLVYSYSNLATAGINWQGEVVSGWSANPKPRKSNVSNSDPGPIDISHVTFHAINIPFSIRLYLGDHRQFSLYGGPRFTIPLSKVKPICYDSSPFDIVTNHRYDILKCLYMLMGCFLNPESDKPLANEVEIKPYFTFDFGFDYNTSFGLIIGMNGFGLTLGYDCAKYLFK